MKPALPAVPRAGDADVAARLAAIDRARRHAALATEAGGRPYLSLVAFALGPGGATLFFATPRDSRKYPALASFLAAATTAIVGVDVEEAVHVDGFQRVTAWRPAGKARK